MFQAKLKRYFSQFDHLRELSWSSWVKVFSCYGEEIFYIDLIRFLFMTAVHLEHAKYDPTINDGLKCNQETN